MKAALRVELARPSLGVTRIEANRIGGPGLRVFHRFVEAAAPNALALEIAA